MNFNFFSKKTLPLIGVDIGSSAVKMVELSNSSKQGWFIKGYAISPLPVGAVVDGNIVKLEVVVDAVKLAWRRLNTREKRVILALPASSVISKKVIMAAGMRENDMEALVEAEANQYIPLSIDEMNIDFQILGPAPGNSGEVEVLIAAARKDKIEDRVAVVEGAGLKASIVDMETSAMASAYTLIRAQISKIGAYKTVMLADIGAQGMHIYVMHENEIVYDRIHDAASNKLTQEMQRRFGLSLTEANIAKQKGNLSEVYQDEILKPFMQSLADEIIRAIQLFTNATPYNGVDYIVLAGECASIAGLDVAVRTKTQISTMVANLFFDLHVNPKINKALKADAPALMIACGLAMRGVND